MNQSYLPEGILLGRPENREYISSVAGLERAMHEGKILESTVLLCDSALRLHVDLSAYAASFRERKRSTPRAERRSRTLP